MGILLYSKSGKRKSADPHAPYLVSHKLFQLIDGGEGYCYIQNQESGKVLAIFGCHGTNQDIKAFPHDGNYAFHKLFRLIYAGGGYCYIQSRNGNFLSADTAIANGSVQNVMACFHAYFYFNSYQLFRFLPGPILVAKRAQMSSFVRKP